MTIYRLSDSASAQLAAKRAEMRHQLGGVGGKVVAHPSFVAQLRSEYGNLIHQLIADAKERRG